MAVVRLVPKISEAPQGPEVRTLDDVRATIRRANLNAIPLDVFKLAELMGLRLSFQKMDDDMSGFLEKQGQQWVVGINSNHNIVRQRFTAAHEIAHFVLHRGDQQRFDDVTFARRSNDRNRMEREADEFSASLLMPGDSVHSLIASGINNLNELANRFHVSPLALKFRLVNLGYAIT